MSVKTRKPFSAYRDILLVSALLGAVFISVLVLFNRLGFLKREKLKPLEQRSHMSMFNDGSSGVMAAAEFLKSCGFSVGKIMDPLATSVRVEGIKQGAAPGVLLIIEPEAVLSQQDIQGIERIASQGFTVLFFSANSSSLEPFARVAEQPEAVFGFAEKDSTELKGVNNAISTIRLSTKGLIRPLSLYLPGRLRWNAVKPPWKIYATDGSSPLAIWRKQGEGKIILFSASRFLSNQNIGREENGYFFYRLLSVEGGDKIIYFDEFFHGYHKRFTLFYFLVHRTSLYFIIQLLIFLSLLFYWSGVRFGPCRVPPRPEEPRSLRYSDGLARLAGSSRYSKEIFHFIMENYRMYKNFRGWKKEDEVEIYYQEHGKKPAGRLVVKRLYNLIKKRANSKES